ncbi:MAG: cupredoxin domain-containing protein [Pseudobdellovibrio sp.]|nr:cupredoxin domain-containing protein [Pseudobdellovibrio sp.]
MKKLGIIALSTLLSAAAFAGKETVELKVTDEGYEPKAINVAPGTDLTLKITRTSDATCATEIVVPDKKINTKLPLNKTVFVHVGKLEQGEVRFGCGMNLMEGGKIYVK